MSQSCVVDFSKATAGTNKWTFPPHINVQAAMKQCPLTVWTNFPNGDLPPISGAVIHNYAAEASGAVFSSRYFTVVNNVVTELVN